MQWGPASSELYPIAANYVAVSSPLLLKMSVGLPVLDDLTNRSTGETKQALTACSNLFFWLRFHPALPSRPTSSHPSADGWRGWAVLWAGSAAMAAEGGALRGCRPFGVEGRRSGAAADRESGGAAAARSSLSVRRRAAICRGAASRATVTPGGGRRGRRAVPALRALGRRRVPAPFSLGRPWPVGGGPCR